MPQSSLAQCWIVWDEMSRGVEKWAKMQQKSAKMMLFWPDNYRCSSCSYHWKLDAVGTGSRGHRVRCNVCGIRTTVGHSPGHIVSANRTKLILIGAVQRTETNHDLLTFAPSVRKLWKSQTWNDKLAWPFLNMHAQCGQDQSSGQKHLTSLKKLNLLVKRNLTKP